MLGTHYHVGTVHGYTMRGHWRYLEYDWAKPERLFTNLPVRLTRWLSPRTHQSQHILFIVEGGLIYLNKSVDGGFAAYEDGFTALELTGYYREAGLDVRQLDLLVR